ncbi:hypothetical protein TMatcc_007822 [Talaromyces marneffei ATCC 18224]|uniref:uncharacterized protein n=1 Tax=Talaromyces marneffei TaxID=37727 RepID=UPI0012A7DD84|nr:uncharacterized protein EYB26_004744 [Talaromyces marneffei]KAE8552791.1 hypothetical protein EYB25_004170 [Talaromyces marneffei]QGA17074.1 hypothetical protein EYB26_004744 [Talaromyces marneffei]
MCFSILRVSARIDQAIKLTERNQGTKATHPFHGVYTSRCQVEQDQDMNPKLAKSPFRPTKPQILFIHFGSGSGLFQRKLS